MTTLYDAIMSLCPQLTPDDFMQRVCLQNDGGDDYVAHWNHPTVARPTDAQIEAAMSLPPSISPAAVKAECARRIYAKASDNAQKNMLANAVAGALTVDELKAFKDGTAWIRSMQTTARALIAANDLDFRSDAKWPACPASSEALAQKF